MSESLAPPPRVVETWSVRKPAVTSDNGIVVSQHYLASEIGAQVLRDGGNAVDAAVATAMAIGAVEPWMSGMGGGGYMVVSLAGERQSHAINFGMRAPLQLDPADYPLTGKTGVDLFAWPQVADDRNIHGPYSVAVPGTVAGLGLAVEQFGSMSWNSLLTPAIELAEQGITVDWFATLKIAASAHYLKLYPQSRDNYLVNDLPPVGEWGSAPPKLILRNLAETLRRLASAGADDFYRGALAQTLFEDASDVGIKFTSADLTDYQATIEPVLSFDYRDTTVNTIGGMSAGPTLKASLDGLRELIPNPGAKPDGAAYSAFTQSLMRAYDYRLEKLGDVDDSKDPACTTHISVVDKQGNAVALTQTLLSVFGSRLTLPRTGILMNNGVMWFNPVPGQPNSMAPGKRPLSNMCPVVVTCKDSSVYAMGASGGRRIMPAIFQLISFLVDYGMTLDEVVHTARIDVSGADWVDIDQRLDAEIIDAIAKRYPANVVANGVYPNLFACPNIAARVAGKGQGAAFVMSPWSSACAE